MQGLQEFRNNITSVFNAYSHDTAMSYESASTQIEIEIERFSVANAVDMPDEAMDEMFAAVANLHVIAAGKGHISEAEACHIVHNRAKDMFEDSRGWEAVEAASQPYVDKIEGNADADETLPQAPPNSGHSPMSFKGPLGHDIGFN